MNAKSWGALVVVMLSLFIFQSSALAENGSGAASAANIPSPMKAVKEKVDSMISALNNPELSKPENRVAQREKIWDIATKMFDFTEISRRTVGKSWLQFSNDEKTQFTEIFSQFLYNTYIEKVEGEYDSEKIGTDKINWEKELIKGNKALVRSKLVRTSATLPIDYKAHLKDNEWRVYDILVENGVSIVQNYRVQFRSILEKEKPAQLIERLQEKLKNQEAQIQS